MLTVLVARTASVDTGGYPTTGSAGKARVSRGTQLGLTCSAFDSLNYYLLVVRALDEGYFKYTPGSSSSLVGSGKVADLQFREQSDAAIRADAEEKHREAKSKEKEGRSRGWGMGRTIGRGAKAGGEKVEIIEDRPGKEGLEGVGVGAINVYLVVFGDGIVSVSLASLRRANSQFHFEDIKQHTNRVRNRILSDASAREAPGSDWVAHGILDSIIDSFLPLARYVDGAVDDIDSLVVDPSSASRHAVAEEVVSEPRSSETLHDDIELDEKSLSSEKKLATYPPHPRKPTYRARHNLLDRFDTLLSHIPPMYIRVPRWLLYLKLFFLPVTNAVERQESHLATPTFDRSTMLKRIQDMRKLVTGLTRTLGLKHQVVAKLRKRATEMDPYVGDIEGETLAPKLSLSLSRETLTLTCFPDHIILIQNSLYHSEYILSCAGPGFLSHLNVSSVMARGGTDQAILALSTVAIGILPVSLYPIRQNLSKLLPLLPGFQSLRRAVPDLKSGDLHLFA